MKNQLATVPSDPTGLTPVGRCEDFESMWVKNITSLAAMEQRGLHHYFPGDMSNYDFNQENRNTSLYAMEHCKNIVGLSVSTISLGHCRRQICIYVGVWHCSTYYCKSQIPDIRYGVYGPTKTSSLMSSWLHSRKKKTTTTLYFLTAKLGQVVRGAWGWCKRYLV